MVDRFCTTLDCVDVTFIADGLLDELPTPAQIGATRVGGIDLNQAPDPQHALAAVLALSAAPGGFTVAELTAKVHTMTGHTGYTIRQAAYDLRKLRGKDLVAKPGRTRRYHLAPQTARHHRRPARPCASRSSHPSSPASAAPAWDANRPPGPPSTATTRQIRIDMQTLFHDLAIRAAG